MAEEKNPRTQYKNEYRKERFKQLNVDIPFKMMEDLEKALKENNLNKRQFVYKCITDFLAENKKKK